ncbi:hypothetical protein Sjap_016564 [Stephania japonica]|uniref:DEK-C domain-containing protein n=1 Tax=Stephania japonica TaxID=461633 RepID=A0AAP0IN80_9MAGN
MDSETLEDKKLGDGVPLAEEKKPIEEKEAEAEEEERKEEEEEDEGAEMEEKVNSDEKEEEGSAKEKTSVSRGKGKRGKKAAKARKKDGDGDESKDSVEEGESKKKRRKRGSVVREPATPIDRPSRERKTVERYSAPTPERLSAVKGVSIVKGSGTQLKDIPNVAFKMSKRKADDNMHMLHSILFGKKSKPQTLKRNISQFSGFVWIENEEKQRAKTKEKIDKCVKEKLLDFCDLLDIPVSKTSTKKEELSAKLLEFLESPRATTEVSLAEKEEKKKRKRTPVSSRKPAGSAKRGKQSGDAEPERKESSKVEDEVEHADDRSDTEDDNDHDKEQLEESDGDAGKSDKGEDETKDKPDDSKKSTGKKTMKDPDVKPRVKKDAPVKSVPSPAKSKKSSTSASKKGSGDGDKVSSAPTKSKGSKENKQKKSDKKTEKGSASSSKEITSGKKRSRKSEGKPALKERGKGKAAAKPKAEPSREEMHAAVSDILKEVDFNTATLSDIIRQLGTDFGMDLMHKKAESLVSAITPSGLFSIGLADKQSFESWSVLSARIEFIIRLLLWIMLTFVSLNSLDAMVES